MRLKVRWEAQLMFLAHPGPSATAVQELAASAQTAGVFEACVESANKQKTKQHWHAKLSCNEVANDDGARHTRCISLNSLKFCVDQGFSSGSLYSTLPDKSETECTSSSLFS